MLTAGLVAARAAGTRGASREVPEWVKSRFQASAPFVRYESLTNRFGLVIPGAILAYGAVWFAWVIATAGTPIVYGVPMAVIPVAVLGLAAWLLRLLPQVLSRAEFRAVRSDGVRAFAVGVFPATATYLVVQIEGLILVRGTHLSPAFIEWSRIDVVGLKASRFGAGVSLSIDGDWYDIPVVLEVGGAVASAWSWDPIGAKRRVLAAAEECFQQFVRPCARRRLARGE